jgi:phage baseplate assembly protein V
MAINGAGLRAWLAPMGRRLSMLAARAVVRLINNLAARQRLQLELLADELQDDVERAQDCGFTSYPLPGCGASYCVAVVVDDRRYRPTDLAPGEVALYTDEGDRIVLRRGSVIAVTAETRIRVDAPEPEFTGNVRIAGTHTHVGVTPGSGVSGTPA